MVVLTTAAWLSTRRIYHYKFAMSYGAIFVLFVALIATMACLAGLSISCHVFGIHAIEKRF